MQMLQQMQQQLALAQMSQLNIPTSAAMAQPAAILPPPPNFKLQAALQQAATGGGPIQAALAPPLTHSPRQSPSQIVPTNPLTRATLDSTGTTQSVHPDSSFEEEKPVHSPINNQPINETDEKVEVDSKLETESKTSSVFDEKKDHSVPKPEKEEKDEIIERVPSRNSIHSKSPLAKSSPLPTIQTSQGVAMPQSVLNHSLRPALHGLQAHQGTTGGLQGLLGALGGAQPGLTMLQQQLLLAQHQVQQQQAQQQQMQQGKLLT